MGAQRDRGDSVRLHAQRNMWTNRTEVNVDGEDILVFHGKVFLTLANEYLADLFMAQFDGYYGGDWEQYRKCKYTRTSVAENEMFMPGAAHRAKVGGGHGESRFDDDAWRCVMPMTDRSRLFEPHWAQLDTMMDEYAPLDWP